MSVISLSSNAEIQSWQLNHQNADLTVNGVTLVGNEAAAYLFGLALSGIDLSAFGSLGQDRFYRTDAVLEFPPGSGQRVSLTEISDALRYKYSIDPLVEFSSSLGLAGYNLADVNNILKSLNDEFQGRFELPLLNRSEGGAQTVYISQPNVAASLQDLLSAEGRKALADLAATVRAKVLSSTELQQKLNPLLGIGLNETVFPGATQNSTVSLNQLLEKFNEATGGDLQTLMPDLFADGKLHFNDVNVLLAAAREAMPSQAAHLADLSLELIRFTQGSQIFTGKQALAMLTANTLGTLVSPLKQGAALNESPAFKLEDRVFTHRLVSPPQAISLGELVHALRQNTGYDPLSHLDTVPASWRVQDMAAYIDGVNDALQPATRVAVPSFTLTSTHPNTIVPVSNRYSDQVLAKLTAQMAEGDRPAYTDDLAEFRRQIGTLSTFKAAGLDIGATTLAIRGSLQVATALQAGVLANSGILARLSLDAPIGLDEPLWQDNQGKVQTLREMLAEANLLNPVLSTLPRLGSSGLDFDGFNKLLVTARRLNPDADRQLEFVHPWFQPYSTANQTFEGGNAMLLRLANSLFAQVGPLTYQNQALASTQRVFADPTDASGQRKLSIDDISQLLTRLLGVDPLPRQSTWFAQDIEQAVKDLYAGVQPAIAAPGRASSAAITTAELVRFVNALVPANGVTFGPDTFDASAALFSHTVNGVTRSRSLNDLLQAFSTQTQKDLAPRLQALGILRDGQTVQLRGLNALRSWVDSVQPGQVTSLALPVTGTPTAVDTSVDYPSIWVTNRDDAWGLGALQRLMTEWAEVPEADRSREWARWQMRFQTLLDDLDDSVGGLAGLGLDTGTQTALRSLTTSATPPELFPQGTAIQAWLSTLQTRLSATLTTVLQDLRNLNLASNNPGYALVRSDLAQRVVTLQQQVLELQQGSNIVSRLQAAGSTLGAFQSALAAETTGQRPDVLAWLARFDIPATDLSNASFRTSTGGLDAFNLAAWTAQAPAAPFTADQAVATLSAAEATWQATAATWNTWFGELLNTRIPALRTSLTADLQLQQAYKAVDPTNAVWDQAITRIQGQLTRSQSLLDAIPALRSAVMTSPDALRTAMQSVQTRLNVTDILAELARHDVPSSDLSQPTNTLPQVKYFDFDTFWLAGSPGAAGTSGYTKQEIQVATQANTAWLTATTPVIDWLASAQTRMQGVLAQVDSAITRLTARWEEPRTTAADRASLADAIDELRRFRAEQPTRLAAAERLLAARNDAVQFNSALTDLQSTLGGPVLAALARFSFDPTSISGTGPHVRSIAGVSCPDLTAAAAAVKPAYANDSILSNAFTAWDSVIPNWRNWISTLASRTAAIVSDLGVSLATLQLQRAQAGNTATENQNIDDAVWRVQTRLAQITAVNSSVARLHAMGNQPAAFKAAVSQEVQALARFADDLPLGQRGIPDLFAFLSHFDVDSMARQDARTTVAVSIERFDYASWLSAYPQGRTPRSTADLAIAFGAWDSRNSHRSWLTEVASNVLAAHAALQADRTRLYQAISADGNDDSALQAMINTIIADQQRLDSVTAALDRLRTATDTATGFAAAVTAAKTAAGLPANTDLFDWLSDFNVPTASLTQAGLRQGAAAIDVFDLTVWQQRQSGSAAFTDSTIGTSNPATWAQALASIKTRTEVVEQALTQAQIRTGWATGADAHSALAAAMAATPAIAANSARASALALAVAAADRLQEATTHVLRSPLVDAEGKLRCRSLEQGDDGRFYYDSQAVLLRVGRMLASLPSELTSVSPSQAAFTDRMWGNRRLSLSDIMAWCREACGFDPLTLADPANQRASWSRAELNFLVDGINQQLRTDAANPVLAWHGSAASVLVSSATPVAGQMPAQVSSAQFQDLLRAQILGSDLSQTVVETELRDELASVINLLGQMDGGDFAHANATAAVAAATQTLNALSMPLSDPTRRAELLRSLNDLKLVLDNNATDSTLNQVQRNLLLQQQLAVMNTQWGVTDVLSSLTSGRLTSANLDGLAEVRAYLTDTKTTAENLRTFYDARLNEAGVRRSAYEKVSPAYSFRASDATRNANVLANLERGLATLQTTYDANVWPMYFMVAIFHNGALHNTGNANPVHWDDVSSWANKLGIDTSNFLTKDLVTANNAPITQAQWKATMVALQQVIGSMRTSMGRYSGEKFDRLESIYAGLRNQGFVANFSQQVNSFGYSLSPSDPTASTTANLRPTSQRIDAAELTTLAVGLFGTDSRIKLAIDAGSNCTQAQWQAALQEFNDLFDLLKTRNQLQAAWQTEQALEHAAYHSLEEITAGLSAMSSLITAANTSASAFQIALTTVGTAQQGWRKDQDVMTWLRSYDVDPALLTYGSQNSLATSYTQYASNSALDPTMATWTSTSVNWGSASMGLGVPSTLPTGTSPALDTANLAIKAAVEAELRGDYRFFDWTRWKLGSVDEADLTGMNRADTARLHATLESTRISAKRLEDYYTDRLNEAQDRVTAFQNIVPGYDFSDPAVNTGHLALLDALVADMTTTANAVTWSSTEFKTYVYSRVLAMPNMSPWWSAPRRADNIDEGEFRSWSDQFFGADSLLSRILASSFWYVSRAEFTQALEQIEQLRGNLRAAVQANAVVPVAPNPFTAQADGIANLIADLEANNAPVSFGSLFGAADSAARYGMTAADLGQWALRTIGVSYVSMYAAADADLIRGGAYNMAADMVRQLRLMETELRAVTPQLSSLQTTVFALDDRLRSWTSPQNFATTVTSSQGNSQLLHMAIGLYGSSSKIKVAWSAGSAVTHSQWNDAVLEAKGLMDHLRALAQLGSARSLAQDEAAAAQTALTEIADARAAIATLSTAAYAVNASTVGTPAETTALTALQAAFHNVNTPYGQDVMSWLRNFQVDASSLSYADPNRLTTRWTYKSGNELTSTARRESTGTTWVSWDDRLMGIPRSASLDATSQQPAYRLAQIAAIEAQLANRFTGFNWTTWKNSVAASTPSALTALQNASTGYTSTTAQAAADRDMGSLAWASLSSAIGNAVAAVETLQAPDVLVVPNGVTDITLRNLDEPEGLSAYGGLVADVTRRDAVQSAVSTLVSSLQANADLSTDQQISRLSAQLEKLQDSLDVDDLLAELTQGVYSTDNLTGSLTGVTEYLNTLTTNATGLQTFMTQRQTEAQTRVDAYARAAGAYDTSMTVNNGVVVPNNDAVGQALSQLYTSLKTRVANMASSGIQLAEAIKIDAVYAAGQYGNEARKRDVPITPEMLRDWCVAKYGSSSSFKQLLDLGTTSTNATLAQAALNEVKGVLFDGAFRNPALAGDPNTLRANQLDALATAMGSSGNLRTVVVPGTHGFDAANLSTWATNLFGPNSKVKAAFDANASVSGTNWTDAAEEVRQLARDIRVTQLASNTAFIDQLQATYNGLSALYSSHDWISHTSTPAKDVVQHVAFLQAPGYSYLDNGKTIYDFTENPRNFKSDWQSLNTGNSAITSDTAGMLSQWLSLPSSAGLIKAAMSGELDDGSVNYGNALKEINELIVQIKQRSNLMPAVLSARQALADAQVPQAEVALAISTLGSLKTASNTGSVALTAAIQSAKTATAQTRGQTDLFTWLRGFDVAPAMLWSLSQNSSLTWQENVYPPSNYTVPLDGSYTGTWPNLTRYNTVTEKTYDPLGIYYMPRLPTILDYQAERNVTIQVLPGYSSIGQVVAKVYSNPVAYAYTETIALNPILRSGTWTPNWTGTGFDPTSTPGFTWGLVSVAGQQTIGVTPYRTRLASLFKAEAAGQFDSFSWRQWKAGGGQTSTGAYVAAYDQAASARTESAVLSGALGAGDLLAIQGQLSGLQNLLRQCRSLADVIQAVQNDSGINLMGLMQQLGIVVDGQYASRDGLNKLLEVLRHEMPERITADTVDALASATESTRSRTLAEFQAAVSVTQQRENALQKLQDHIDSWNNYTTLYERRTHWTQWLAELQTLATTSRAQVGELGLDMDALIATLQADTSYTQASANALGSYVPHLTFFTQVRWRTEQLLDHWFDLWDTLEVKRKEYVAYANNSGNGATNNSAANIAAAKVQIAAIDALQAKIEAKRQATVQVNEAVNHFLTIVPPSATPAAITGEKLELLQQAVADFKQQIGGQDVMAYLHDFSVPVSAWQGHSNTATKDNYTFISLGGSAADNVANGPVRYVASLSPSVFSFEKWLNTPNPQGAAATSLSVSDTITDQYAYVTGLLTNASKTDTSLLNLGKIPSDETWTEVTQKLGTARTVARNALLQSQAQLKLDYADIGAALSGLRKVQVPGGYDGYWYQMALALQSLQSTDLPANGVTATAAVLEYPPGSGERVSLKTLLDNLQTQAAADPQRTALAQKLLDVLQDDPTTQLGTNATLLTQAKLLDTGLLSRFENTTNLSNFAGALVTAFGDAISNSQISAWGVSLFGADSRLAAAIALGNTTLTSAQWTAASRELRLIQEDLERGYAGALHGQTQTVKAAATRAVILSEALTTLDAATTFSGYAASLTTLCGGSRPFALSTTNMNQWATQLFGSGSALSAAIAATGTLTSAQWQAANAELSLIQQDIAKGEGGVLYGNKQAKLAALVNEASQGGDPLAVLTNGVFSLRDLQTDGSKTIKNSLADANNLSRLHGFLQGTLLGDAQRLNVAQQVQGVLTPDAATDGLDAALTLKLQSALASLRSTYSAHNWNTTATKDMTVSLNGLFTTDELTRLRSDAVGLRAESRAINQYAAYGSGRLERAIGLAATAGQTDWLLALSELDWLLTARTFRSADQLLGGLDKPAGVDDWLLAVTQGQVSDADLSIDAFAKGADTSDILVKLWADAATIFSNMSATDTRIFVNDQTIRQVAYGLDPDIAWAGRGSGYGISLTELSELAKTFAGPDSKLAYAVSNPDGSGPIKGYVFGPALTKTQMAEVLKELEGIIVGGLRQQQVNASLTQALNDVANNTRLPDAPLRLASVFAGVVDMNTLDWAKRQTLLSAIRQALPSVDAALQSWAEPEPDNAGQRMALTVAQRIREWKAAYEETASRTFMATATSLELRNSLTEGADIYVDRHGTYYIDGMRTRAMDVAVMTRAVAHTSFAAEYKELMDAMAERNALIAAANSYVNNVNNVTATATATSSTPRAYAAYQVWQLLDSSTFTGAANDTVRKDLLKAKLLEVQPASGSTDLLYDITSGRVTLSTFDASLYVTSTANTVANGVQFSSVKEAISEFIKFENLLEPLRKQSNNVTSGDILSDMTGGSYSLKGSNVPLNKSAERIWTFLHTQPSGGGGSAANFTTVLAEESARNGGIDILSAVTGGDYTSVNWNSNWGTGQMANIKGKVTDFITKTPGRAPYFTSDIEKLTNLFNTLISNKVRDNDLDQGKLQSITSQIQVNTEAMTALIKAFNELNSALAQALK